MFKILEELIYFTKFPKRQLKIWKYNLLKSNNITVCKNVKDNFNFAYFENPEVSILIPVYNHYQQTVDCLYSILENVKNISYEVILIDDCSCDATCNIQKRIKGINVIRNSVNLGFLRNCNNAAQYAKGKYIWLLNNDTQILPNALESLIEVFKKKEDAGVVGSKLVYPNLILQEAGGIVYNNGESANFGRLMNKDSLEYNYLKEVDYCTGASILVKKTLWDEVKGFDETFIPAYYEDTDLCFEARKLGFKVYYQPRSEVIHLETVTMKDSIYGLISQNRVKFVKKWEKELQNQLSKEDIFFAKERSFGKKVLVFIEDNVLAPDKSCGERSSFQYLQAFKEMGFNVKFVSLNMSCEKRYIEAIEDLGVEIIMEEGKGGLNKAFFGWLKRHGEHIDYVLINRPDPYKYFIEEIRKYSNAKIFYQGHDIHYLRRQREYEVNKDKKVDKDIEKFKILEPAIWEDADLTLYFSDKETEIVKKVCPHANAKTVPLFLYNKTKLLNYDPKERKDLVFVGGFGHNPNIDAMEWFIGEVYPFLARILPDIKINIVGTGAPRYLLKEQTEHIIFKGYISDEELENLYKITKLAVSPLRFGAGVKEKILEAMRYGVPVISTSIGIEGIESAGGLITVADRASDYAAKIVELYQNDEKLIDISKKSQDFINKNYTGKTLADLFDRQDEKVAVYY